VELILISLRLNGTGCGLVLSLLWGLSSEGLRSFNCELCACASIYEHVCMYIIATRLHGVTYRVQKCSDVKVFKLPAATTVQSGGALVKV
jgi:hypothetical protein